MGFGKVKWASALFVATISAALPAQAQIAPRPGFAIYGTGNTVVTTEPEYTVNTTVNARAGLVPILWVQCHSVDFGQWRVPIRNTGGATFIQLTVSANDATGATNANIFGNRTSVSLNSQYPPKAGLCEVFNAQTVSSRLRTGVVQNNAMHMGGLGVYGAQPAPVIPALVVVDLALGGNGVLVDANGDGSFRVVGTLTIPETIVKENYGGYQSTDEAMVSVTDVAL